MFIDFLSNSKLQKNAEIKLKFFNGVTNNSSLNKIYFTNLQEQNHIFYA